MYKRQGLQSRGIKIVSDGTDNHLMLVDLTPFGLTGKSIEKLIDAAHITANKNTIPNDPQKPFVTSGIRLGTPAATSRGLKAVSYTHLDVYMRQDVYSGIIVGFLRD